MKLRFITSVSPGYWQSVGKRCIESWNLPGEVTVYVDQQEGDLSWVEEIAYDKKLLRVPKLKNYGSDNTDDEETAKTKTKVRKFWGKACAQIHALKTADEDTRIIWLDADVEQLKPITEELFTWHFAQPVAMMKSNDWSQDCYETGLVIFNQQNEKLNLFVKNYEAFWKDPDQLGSLYRPYDAIVLGTVAGQKKSGFFNLCNRMGENVDALNNTQYASYFKHWINKANKRILIEGSNNEDS